MDQKHLRNRGIPLGQGADDSNQVAGVAAKTASLLGHPEPAESAFFQPADLLGGKSALSVSLGCAFAQPLAKLACERYRFRRCVIRGNSHLGGAKKCDRVDDHCMPLGNDDRVELEFEHRRREPFTRSGDIDENGVCVCARRLGIGKALETATHA